MKYFFNSTVLKFAIVQFLVLFFRSISAQTPPQWFETQWDDALVKCISSRQTILTSLRHPFISPAEVMSVVFPEMLRYSMWRNLLETKALEVLYVQAGSKAADFSIGWFQMKPSFAELVEREVSCSEELFYNHNSLLKFNALPNDTASIRRQRVQRLKQMLWQLRYLNAFVAIASNRYPLQDLPADERVKIMAAAYNRGINVPLNELIAFNKSKTFPYGPREHNPFGYAQVAVYFYVNNAQKIFTNPNR